MAGAFLLIAGTWQVVLGQSGRFTIGDSARDVGRFVIRTTDGGVVIVGSTVPLTAGDIQAYVIKMNSAGNIEWTRRLGEYATEGFAITQTADGGYALTGITHTSFLSFASHVLVAKLDAQGNLEWAKAIGGPNNDEGHAILQTSDGGYLVVGTAQLTFIPPSWYIYVLKLDANGNIEWTRAIGHPGLMGMSFNYGYSVVETGDGGYLIAGSEVDGIYLAKLDGNGLLQWAKVVTDSLIEEAQSIVATSDGGFAIVGYTESFGQGASDVYVLKLDANGDLQWAKAIGGPGEDEGYAIIETGDGGYAIAGFTTSFGVSEGDTSANVYVVKLDGSGNIEWTRVVGGPEEDYAYGIAQRLDGGYVVVGLTRSFGLGYEDVYVIWLDANGNIDLSGCPDGTTTGGTAMSGMVSPLIDSSDTVYMAWGELRGDITLIDTAVSIVEGCTSGGVGTAVASLQGMSQWLQVIRLSGGGGWLVRLPRRYTYAHVTLLDVMGRVVYQKEETSVREMQIDEELGKGMYILRVETEEGIAVVKLWE